MDLMIIMKLYILGLNDYSESIIQIGFNDHLRIAASFLTAFHVQTLK